MKKYFFILGNHPTLSIAELMAVFPNAPASVANQDALLLDLEEEIEAKRMIANIGGTIKVGKIFNQQDNFDLKKIISAITETVDKKNIQGKYKFGLSFYGRGKINLKQLGMELKNKLKDAGLSSRWVTSKEPMLSSVVVEQNKLTDKGLEVVLIRSNNKILLGKTLAVQPFKQLSFRDYGRPARDDRSGMLPPKLAQIMINLALAPSTYEGESKSEVILDPFCGSGTILTEAMLMGLTNLIGSDISKKAITDTKSNIEWIIKNYQLLNTNYKLFNNNVTELPKFIKPNSVDAIITEPYLGPQRGKINFGQTISQLNDLYSRSLKIFELILKPEGRIIMVWPIFLISHNSYRLAPNLNNFKIINPIPEHFKKNLVIKLTDRKTIIYGRPGQKVWREIVIMEK